jgi:hypothetical protein
LQVGSAPDPNDFSQSTAAPATKPKRISKLSLQKKKVQVLTSPLIEAACNHLGDFYIFESKTKFRWNKVKAIVLTK